MIYEVTTTNQADDDLRGVYEYIAFELLSPDNAAGQLERLEEHIIVLESFPEKFRAYGKEPWHSRGLRVMPVDNYLVFYIPDKEAGIVTVIRVMYAGRNVDDQLKNHTVQHGIGIAELARISRVSERTTLDIMAGIKQPELGVMCKIAEGLAICVHQLRADEEHCVVSVSKDNIAKLIVVSELNSVEIED